MNRLSKPFRVSTRLKDLIGRDLITNNSVALFELVKNSFDAHATRVVLLFEQDRLVVADNGKGMSRDDILNKWLFVAYSAKREGTEDQDYRSRIKLRSRAFAGDKGVGRFSCDRLGRQLSLASRASRHPVQIVRIDWTKYEEEATREFREVLVDVHDAVDFPRRVPSLRSRTGTVLDITDLRHNWTRSDLLSLRKGLEKLISPFGHDDTKFQIELLAPLEESTDQRQIERNLRSDKDQHLNVVNGLIQNTIMRAVEQRTTSIRVTVPKHSNQIETVLRDRGELIYRIREDNPYGHLLEPKIEVELFFLNRKAKQVFVRRMGLPSVQFGSIFLFKNGFRVFPIGEERDDFYGLNRRKQQGTRRYLGTRDLIGRVEISGGTGFDEATSRDRGLIRSTEVNELLMLILQKCVRRLERYVVDVTWRDPHDQLFDDTSRMHLDANSALVIELVSQLADTDGVELEEYSPNLIRILDERSEQFESSLAALEILAEKTGDSQILARVQTAKLRLDALEEQKEQAEEARRRAEEERATAQKAADAAERKYAQEQDRNRFLVAATSLDVDTIVNLHHQIGGYASDVQVGIQRMMGKIQAGEEVTQNEWVDFLDNIGFRNSQILTAAHFASKTGYLKDVESSEQDLATYVRDYIALVARIWSPREIEINCHGTENRLVRSFRPIDIGIVIDNLVSNASKAHASRIDFVMETQRMPARFLTIHVADNGIGWPDVFDPIQRVFDKGTTTTDGAGLGLYHVRQVVESMRGLVRAHRRAYSESLGGAYLTVSLGK